MAAKRRKERKSKGTSPDPFLRSFLRQAVAVIAAEKGLTDSSRAKLRQIASELGLSDQDFRDAMEQLKTPGSSLGLNRYEQKFTELVSKELKKFKGDVLSIRYEKRLAELAQNKYQIPPVRAHQLIQKAAGHHGIGIISHSDAQQFVQNLVEDSVGNRRSLENSEIQKLSTIGEKWGISKQATQRQIQEITRRNRVQQRIATTKRFAIYGCCLATILATTWALRQIDWSSVFKNGQSGEGVVADSNEAKLDFPEWWTQQMIDESHKFNRRLRNRLNDLTANKESNENRQKFYSELVGQAVNRQRSLAPFVVDAYYKQPDSQPALAIADQLVGIFNMNGRVLSAGHIRRSKRAAEILSDLNFFPTDSTQRFAHRRSQIQQRIETLVGDGSTASTKNELKSYLTDSLALQLWTRSMQSSQTNPKTTAASLAELEKFSLNESPEINELRIRTCQKIIYSSPVQWNNIRPSIEKSISQSNRSNVYSWIRIALNNTLPQEMRNFLAAQLSKKLRLNSASDSTTFANIENYLRSSSTGYTTTDLKCCNFLESEIQKLNSRLRISGISNFDLAKSKVAKEDLPELIQAVAETNNNLLAWIKRKATPETLTTSARNSEKLSSANFPPLIASTPSQQRQFNESVGRLNSRDPDVASTRIRAISKLRELAPSFRSIASEHADALAQYILGLYTPQEQLAVERALPDFKHWVRLKLAIADRIEQATIGEEDLVDFLSRLAIKLNKESKPDLKFYEIVRLSILQDCHLLLESKGGSEPESLMWSAFEEFYSSTIDERLQTIGANRPNASTEQKIGSALVQQSAWLQNHIYLMKHQNSTMERWILTCDIVATLINEQNNLDVGSSSWNSGSAGHGLLSSELDLFRVLKTVFRKRHNLIAGGS